MQPSYPFLASFSTDSRGDIVTDWVFANNKVRDHKEDFGILSNWLQVHLF